MKKNGWYYLLIFPGLLLLALFLMIPLLRIIIPTFFPNGTFSLELYRSFISNKFYLGIFFRTIRISVLTCLICIVLAVPVSFYISRMRAAKKGLMIALATFPLLTNTVVRAFAWTTILGKTGILNTMLVSSGLIPEPVQLLYTEGAIIVGSVYLFLPIMLISLVGVMENISDEIQEAALSLGANRLVTFIRIIIPLSMPGIIVGSVLVFAGTASAYSTPLMLGGNRNMVMSTLIYQQAMLLGNWNSASVIAALMIVTSYVVVNVLNWIAAKLNKAEARE